MGFPQAEHVLNRKIRTIGEKTWTEMETYVDDRPLLLPGWRRWFELESDEWETTLVEATVEESCWGCWELSEWPEDDGSL